MTLQLSRRARTWWSRALIASLLFLQLATSAYACAMRATPSSERAGAMAGMPCAQAMAGEDSATPDPDQPGLCHEHCKGGSPTLEPGAAASPAVPALLPPFVVEARVEPAGECTGCSTRRVERDSAPPPPHAILHCCWRI